MATKDKKRATKEICILLLTAAFRRAWPVFSYHTMKKWFRESCVCFFRDLKNKGVSWTSMSNSFGLSERAVKQLRKSQADEGELVAQPHIITALQLIEREQEAKGRVFGATMSEIEQRYCSLVSEKKIPTEPSFLSTSESLSFFVHGGFIETRESNRGLIYKSVNKTAYVGGNGAKSLEIFLDSMETYRTMGKSYGDYNYMIVNIPDDDCFKEMAIQKIFEAMNQVTDELEELGKLHMSNNDIEKMTSLDLAFASKRGEV